MLTCVDPRSLNHSRNIVKEVCGRLRDGDGLYSTVIGQIFGSYQLDGNGIVFNGTGANSSLTGCSDGIAAGGVSPCVDMGSNLKLFCTADGVVTVLIICNGNGCSTGFGIIAVRNRVFTFGNDIVQIVLQCESGLDFVAVLVGVGWLQAFKGGFGYFPGRNNKRGVGAGRNRLLVIMLRFGNTCTNIIGACIFRNTALSFRTVGSAGLSGGFSAVSNVVSVCHFTVFGIFCDRRCFGAITISPALNIYCGRERDFVDFPIFCYFTGIVALAGNCNSIAIAGARLCCGGSTGKFVVSTRSQRCRAILNSNSDCLLASVIIRGAWGKLYGRSRYIPRRNRIAYTYGCFASSDGSHNLLTGNIHTVNLVIYDGRLVGQPVNIGACGILGGIAVTQISGSRNGHSAAVGAGAAVDITGCSNGIAIGAVSPAVDMQGG